MNLAKEMTKKGWNIIILSSSKDLLSDPSNFPKNIRQISLENSTEEILQSAIQQILEETHVSGVICLTPSANSKKKNDLLNDGAASKRLKQSFSIAKFLGKSLNQSKKGSRSFFISTTRMDGALGIKSSKSYDVFQSGLLGLTKTLNLEWEHVFCRAIDIAPKIDNKAATQIIMNEIEDPDCKLIEVGYQPDGRGTLKPQLLPQTTEMTPFSISSSNVFLVSGGGRGITADCMVEMASQFQCKFILLGRSHLTTEPAWARGCDDSTELKKRIFQDFKDRGEKPLPKAVDQAFRSITASRDIHSTLSRISEVGGQANYVQTDITKSEIREKIKSAIAKLGPVSGIIHGAGVLADKPIEKKTQSDLDLVFSTKLDGLKNLLGAVPNDQLKYLILFSSASGFYGNAGQSDYSAANEILNKIAYQFGKQHPECHVASFNWGPWDGGMVTPELKKMFESKNISLIPISEGQSILIDGLHPTQKDTIQLLVGSPMPTNEKAWDTDMNKFVIKTGTSLKENSFLKDHTIGNNPVLPAACALFKMVNSCEQLYPGYHFVQSEGFQIFKGIVFEATDHTEYTLEIDKTMKTDKDIEFQVKIFIENANHKIIPCYQSKIRLQKSLPDIPNYAFDLTESDALDGSVFYHNGTLFHGPEFQGIDRQLVITDKKLVLECRIPDIPLEHMMQFSGSAFHPLAVDLGLQAMLVSARKHYQSASLPLKISVLKVYQPMPIDVHFYISFDIKNAGKNILQGDVTLHDAQGQIYLQLLEAEVTVSSTLNSLFKK